MRRYFFALLCAVTALGQAFNSGSTGADGDLIINAPGVTPFNQTPIGGGTIFNFKSIQIAAGSTLKLTGQMYPTPLYFLAQSTVSINGTIDLSGGIGQTFGSDPSLRVPAVPGPGGYSGGLGTLGSSPAQPGNGPGGGAIDQATGFNCFPQSVGGAGGTFTANQFLVPLIGGSGGAGGSDSTGGAGGGAILIASSESISVNGTITANGGVGGVDSGSGSGGAIRLAANSISGSGTITALGGSGNSGCSPVGAGGNGLIRLEAFQNTFSGTLNGPLNEATPFNTFVPTSVPSIEVVNIGGAPVSTSPTGSFTVPDVTVNSNSPLVVQIQAQNVPLGTTATLFFFSENGPDQTITSTGLAGMVANSTATAMVTLPPGFSRGYVKATWTQ